MMTMNNENYEYETKKIKTCNDNKTTILDLLTNDITREQKINYLNIALTKYFPELEGDISNIYRFNIYELWIKKIHI